MRKANTITQRSDLNDQAEKMVNRQISEVIEVNKEHISGRLNDTLTQGTSFVSPKSTLKNAGYFEDQQS